jgi:hypothetical protein
MVVAGCCGLLPTQQCLDFQQLSVLHVDDGLVSQRELVAAERVTQLRAAAGRLYSHYVVDRGPVRTAPIGLNLR